MRKESLRTIQRVSTSRVRSRPSPHGHASSDHKVRKYRRVVGGVIPTPRLAIDPTIRAQFRQRLRRPDMIEAKASVLWERRFSERVPPRVFARLIVHLSEDVDKSPLL